MNTLSRTVVISIVMVISISTVSCIHQHQHHFKIPELIAMANRTVPKETIEFMNEFQRQIFALLSAPKSLETCISNVLKIPNELIIQYIDSLGKPGAGILEGNLMWLGSFDECKAIPSAHFCTMKDIILHFQKYYLPITYGMCVPDVCSVEDVKQLIEIAAKMANSIIANKTGNHNVIIVNPTENLSYCHVKDVPYRSGAIGMIVISSIILALCFVGTVVDLTLGVKTKYKKSKVLRVQESVFPIPSVHGEVDASINENNSQEENEKIEKNVSMYNVDINEEDKFIIRFLKCFSWPKNIKAVLNTDVPKGSITSINGVRTISITWVVLGHTILFLLQTAANPSTIFLKWLPRFSMKAIIDAPVSVDTFFLLSGILVAYLSLKRLDTTGRLPLVRYYLHRYVRLTPSYAYLIFFTTFLLPYIADGPIWRNIDEPNCIKNWWTNLLYINNIVPDDITKECFGVAWYLAIDMQYYVISPVLLYVMYKFQWIGVVIISCAFFVINSLTNGVIVGKKEASPVFTMPSDIGKNPLDPNANTSSSRYSKYVYFKTYTRIGPYIVGLVLGYILYYKKQVRPKLRLPFYAVGWMVAIATGMAVVYGPHANDGRVSEATNVFYCIMFRTVWAIAVGWVIYACHNGYGGLINDFLSWKAFIPLSRLTYGVYLIHIYVIMFYGSTLHNPFVMTEINLSFNFIAITFFSFVLSFIVSVCIEYPVFNLEQLIIGRFNKNTHKRL